MLFWTSPSLRRGARFTLLGLAAAAATWTALAHESVKTPGTPPGIVLPAPLPPDFIPPAPAWDGVAFRKGVVSVSHPLAAKAGADVLARGGNAIDAAAAVQFMLNVVEPQFSGIGGGGFMMVHLARHNRSFAIDAREKAPAAATASQFMLNATTPLPFGTASTSGLSVGVPGTLAALDFALRRHGTIKLSEAVAPAIKVAEEGFAINRFLALNIANDGGRTSLQPETRALFRPNGAPLAAGALLVQPDLAKTFRLIAKHGPDVFYKGEVADAMVQAQLRSTTVPASAGVGRMTKQDLANYTIVIRKPVSVNYRGWKVAAMSPPSSGGLTLGQMLLMLERFPIGEASQDFGFGAPTTLHVMTEAMRLAFADRAVWMGDEDFVHVPKVGLLSQAYVDSRSALIDPSKRMATPAAGDPRSFDTPTPGPSGAHDASDHDKDDEQRPSHTTHFSVVDKWGNVVSYTTTIEATWGTGITVPGYGFLLNNELTDFNFAPTANASPFNPGANDVAPNKRPRSSMSPAILFKGRKPVAAFGSPGGATIINSVLNVTLNLVDHGMTIQQAIDAPRLSVTGAAGTISCEGTEPFHQPKFSVTAQDALRGLGHLGLGATLGVNSCINPIGSVQGVVIDLRSGRQYGGADPRREGTVIGLKPRKPRVHDDDRDDD